jgi:cell division septum initiation protein DivIVA
VIDNGMKSRVRGLLSVPAASAEPFPDPDPQQQALNVLNLAQKTADDHIADAHRKADRIHADARTSAEQIIRDAQVHAERLQQEADVALSDARATTAQVAREARAQAEKAQHNAEEVLAEARARADEIARNARAGADELRYQAQQRYEDAVGGLAARRGALQRQIEALEQFDREYRARLTGFMQHQLRTLWADEPHVNAEDLEQSGPVASSTRPPAAREPS